MKTPGKTPKFNGTYYKSLAFAKPPFSYILCGRPLIKDWWCFAIFRDRFCRCCFHTSRCLFVDELVSLFGSSKLQWKVGRMAHVGFNAFRICWVIAKVNECIVKSLLLLFKSIRMFGNNSYSLYLRKNWKKTIFNKILVRTFVLSNILFLYILLLNNDNKLMKILLFYPCLKISSSVLEVCYCTI